ncbi:MAG: ABC transporter permease [Eubacterium sp.]|nr:ABC transporter permease [Eubacterium sp.]
MLKLAYQYMRYYKSQTCAIFISIVLTSGLLTGISSLLHSSQMNDLEHDRLIYGDWHYNIHVEADLAEEILHDQSGKGYQVAMIGRKIIKDVARKPFQIFFVETDMHYRQMAHRQLTKGRYPQRADEIAADNYTLGNLGFQGGIGDSIEIEGKKYYLSGIMKSEWSTNTDSMEVFVSSQFQGIGAESFLYVKFDEGRALYKQLDHFLVRFQISGDKVQDNDNVNRYLLGEEPDSIYEIIKFGLTNEQGNFTYIILKLQSEYNLTFYGMLLFLCLFSLFVIYSIFNISVSKRMAQYGILQTVGIAETNILQAVVAELWILFCLGYPLGAALSNGIFKIGYQRIGAVFGNTSGMGNETLAVSSEMTLADSGAGQAYFISWTAILTGFIILFAALAGIGCLTVKRIKKQTLREIMSERSSSVRRSRKIYSYTHKDLSGVILRKFMFGKKRKLIGMLFSLSLGGCIFLCTSYMIENLKIHAEMSLKSDDGLNSEYKISLKTKSLSDEISEETVQKIKRLPDLDKVYATKYTLGEITIDKNELEWEHYFDEHHNDAGVQKDYGGLLVERQNQNLGIKYDIYGYDADMIRALDEYLLEGEIDLEKMQSSNKIIAVANVDAQGNYNFYGKHPGDLIKVKVPKSQKNSDSLLKFESSPDQYIETELEIAAVVSRALVKEENFLIRGVWKTAPSIIMTNGQMQMNFDIGQYKIINASGKKGADRENITKQLLAEIQDIPKAVLQDYTKAIESQKNYLRQQQMFFTAIAVIVLIMSLFHIMNSMSYSILARRYEFGLLRAMGTTDSKLYRIIAKEGIWYGVLANVLLILLFGTILQKIMIYYMQHVVQFLHISASVPRHLVIMIVAFNIVISVIAVLMPAGRMIKDSIIDEIRKIP